MEGCLKVAAPLALRMSAITQQVPRSIPFGNRILFPNNKMITALAKGDIKACVQETISGVTLLPHLFLYFHASSIVASSPASSLSSSYSVFMYNSGLSMGTRTVYKPSLCFRNLAALLSFARPPSSGWFLSKGVTCRPSSS